MSTLNALGLTSYVLCALVVGCAAPATSQRSPNAPPMTPSFKVDQTSDGLTWNPYHAVVRAKVLAAFRGLTDHDVRPALGVMAEDVTYTFDGDHALGGTRVSRAGVERWFGRLLRLLPGPFAIRSVEVTGWPWSTRAVTTFEHQVTPPNGPAYWAGGTQVVELRWGAAVHIRTRVADMAKLEQTLDAMARSGESEATAPQIVE